ncbi:hypothetical protein MAC_02004 [Metarhizium acridum CQMa 102]|uniref:C2H2-type domain-containing protein n=1 Tax=Metarhizium acridum (strain CQMa 102) TaxID=655827 RepID=E9DWK6_METAQ|nr:uncharacterized protein MAC_02004 [Metarhizium acridum CQMa 102]EFY92056.1 hypothetical protein MAC_02004 [Metarhizium acridum CQMa 102]
MEDCGIDTELKEILGDEKFEFDSELAQLSVDIADIINSLLRLSMSIRNPAPHDHFVSTEYAEASYFSDFDVRRAGAKYKDANQDLVRRLGEAISRRRRYLKYRESHHAKLSQGLDLDQGCAEAGEKSTVASSVPLAIKDVGKSAPLFGELDEDDHSETNLPDIIRHDRTRLRETPSPASSRTIKSTAGVTNGWITCSKRIGRPGDAQAHAKDVGPLKRPLGNTLQQLHSAIASSGGLSAIIARNERMKPLDAKTDCPLCGETLDSTKQYQRHVGKHLVDLALFTFPKTGDREDPDDDVEMCDDKVDDGSEVDEDNEMTVDNELDQADELDVEAEMYTTELEGGHEMLQTAGSNSIPSNQQTPKALAKVNKVWQCVRIIVHLSTQDQIIIRNNAPAMVAGSRFIWTISV